jgi:hypothetical protein
MDLQLSWKIDSFDYKGHSQNSFFPNVSFRPSLVAYTRLTETQVEKLYDCMVSEV